MQRVSTGLLLLAAAALARADTPTTTTGVGPDPTGDTIMDRLLDPALNSRLLSAETAAFAFATASGYDDFQSAYDPRFSEWWPTQTLVPTSVRPPSNTGDPDPSDEELARHFEGSVQIIKSQAEVAEERMWLEDEETQKEWVAAMKERVEVYEEALGVLKKKLGMEQGEGEGAGKDGAEKEEGAEKDGAEKGDDESRAGAVAVSVRALGAVLAAGVLAVMAL